MCAFKFHTILVRQIQMAAICFLKNMYFCAFCLLNWFFYLTLLTKNLYYMKNDKIQNGRHLFSKKIIILCILPVTNNFFTWLCIEIMDIKHS